MTTLKSTVMILIVVGVFGLCGVGLYNQEMTVTQALATAMASLSSAGALTLVKEPKE